MRLGKYLVGGTIPEDKYNLEDLLWDAPRQLEEHCKMVAAVAGTHIAATIQSWTLVEKIDFDFIKWSTPSDLEGTIQRAK